MEEHSVEDALHANARYAHSGLVAVEMPQHERSRNGGYSICSSDAQPHSISTPNFWKDNEEWHEEHELAAHGEKDALFYHAYALEEVACDNLKADDGEHTDNDAHSRYSDRN